MKEAVWLPAWSVRHRTTTYYFLCSLHGVCSISPINCTALMPNNERNKLRGYHHGLCSIAPPNFILFSFCRHLHGSVSGKMDVFTHQFVRGKLDVRTLQFVCGNLDVLTHQFVGGKLDVLTARFLMAT